jgi:hypothetical protein
MVVFPVPPFPHNAIVKLMEYPPSTVCRKKLRKDLEPIISPHKGNNLILTAAK